MVENAKGAERGTGASGSGTGDARGSCGIAFLNGNTSVWDFIRRALEEEAIRIRPRVPFLRN